MAHKKDIVSAIAQSAKIDNNLAEKVYNYYVKLKLIKFKPHGCVVAHGVIFDASTIIRAIEQGGLNV